MRRTSIPGLIGTAVFMTAASLILVRAYYGRIGGVSPMVSVMLWMLSALGIFAAVKVRERIKEGRVGLDRSQMHPVTIAQLMVLGQAGAWTGAILGGGYLGLLIYVALHLGQLTAAGDDLPGALLATAGSVALCVTGLILEKNCQVPPPADGEPVG